MVTAKVLVDNVLIIACTSLGKKKKSVSICDLSSARGDDVLATYVCCRVAFLYLAWAFDLGVG